jgi:hypothetical protein
MAFLNIGATQIIHYLRVPVKWPYSLYFSSLIYSFRYRQYICLMLVSKLRIWGFRSSRVLRTVFWQCNSKPTSTTNQRCITSRKIEDLNYTAVEIRNLEKEFRGIMPREGCIVLNGKKNKFCFISFIFLSTWLIFGTEDIHIVALSKVEFRKNLLSETHTLRRVLQDFLSPISIFFSDLCRILCI